MYWLHPPTGQGCFGTSEMKSSQNQAVAPVVLLGDGASTWAQVCSPQSSHDGATYSRQPVPLGSRLVILSTIPACVSAFFYPQQPKGLLERKIEWPAFPVST